MALLVSRRGRREICEGSGGDTGGLPRGPVRPDDGAHAGDVVGQLHGTCYVTNCDEKGGVELLGVGGGEGDHDLDTSHGANAQADTGKPRKKA